MAPADRKLPIVILISGSGSNLQAIIDAVRGRGLPVEIRAVISNRSDAQGLARAEQAGITTRVIDHGDYPGREAFDAALRAVIDSYRPEVVVLAGFMRILSDEFVNHYRGHLLNIHPSLLPALRGLNTHARALAEGLSEHGASVHYVTPELDGGPVILQAQVPVQADDSADTLAARVLGMEHRIYPQVLNWIAEGRLRLEGDEVIFDNKALRRPLQWRDMPSEQTA